MVRHLFTLIWNKKKQNFLLMAEMLISFIVLFAVFTMVVYCYQNYRKPMGFNYENVWVINYNNTLNTTNDSAMLFYETVKRSIKSLPQVKEVAYASGNVPFSQNTMQTGVSYNKKPVNSVNMFQVEDSYKDVLNVKVLQGRWFNKQDAVAKEKAMVINTTLKENLFGDEDAIGKLVGDDKAIKIIGVVQDLKIKGDFEKAGNAMFVKIDTGSIQQMGKMLVSVTPDADVAFEGRLYKTVTNSMKNANIEIEHLTTKRTSINYYALVPMIILSIVAGFLIINVALGLFGVLWYNINKRRGEIGLRRAIGATGNSVSFQLVSEALILATFSLVAGAFFAIQFPLLNVFDLPRSVYLTALALAVLFIYLLVLGCALYPGRQAAGIYPAVALHED